MKATGIIRRVDDLRRIMIPKELRRTLTIREGDPMEFYITDDNIILVQYDPNTDIKHAIEKLRLFLACEAVDHKDELLAKIDEMNAILDAEKE